jgi:hypothetical protein
MIPRSLSPYLFDDWFDPIETCLRGRVREFIGRFNAGRFEVEHPGEFQPTPQRDRGLSVTAV